jgi:exonuclease III
MAFRNKSSILFDQEPDIAIVPECSEQDSKNSCPDGYSSLWFGKNVNKGVAIFCRSNWTIHAIEPPIHPWVIPLQVRGIVDFTLIAVWSWLEQMDYAAYVARVKTALADNPKWFDSGSVVIAGDFNSNCQWDHITAGGHTALVSELDSRGLMSSYHVHYDEIQGQETRPTFYMNRKVHLPFHIDYVFIPKEWRDLLRGLSVGEHAKWSAYSDHCPIIVDLAF